MSSLPLYDKIINFGIWVFIVVIIYIKIMEARHEKKLIDIKAHGGKEE